MVSLGACLIAAILTGARSPSGGLWRLRSQLSVLAGMIDHQIVGGRTLNTVTYKNSILKAVGPEIVGRLGLRLVKFELGREIEFPGEPIKNLFFVEQGMASLTTTFEDGSQVEVGMFGYESVIGISALMGTKHSLNRVYTQIEGHGYACPIDLGRREFLRSERFHDLALRYVQAQLLQTMQSAGCNVKHDLEQRLARWLLLCADRAHTDTFVMPHEFLSDMLGATRPSVSIAAKQLKDKNLIHYSRGLIRILDSPALQRTACECYGTIKRYLDNYAEFDSGTDEASPNKLARLSA